MKQIPMRELKEGAQRIAERYNIDFQDGVKIIAYYTARGLWDDARKVLEFNEDYIKESAQANNITLCAAQKEKRKKEGEKDLPEVRNTKKKKEPLKPSEVISGFLPNYKECPLSKGELPEDLPDLVSNFMDAYCNRFKIEDISKASAERWRGFCMMFGFEVKKSHLLEDIEREKKEGGKVFDPERVENLLTMWASLCSAFDKVPLVGDFISFSGVSSSWFYNNNGASELTSASVEIYKKLMELQEVGISGRIVDGRRNPTGSIFFLKNWHGWKDQREVVHIDENKGATGQGLPMFDD